VWIAAMVVFAAEVKFGQPDIDDHPYMGLFELYGALLPWPELI
jgi:hypothetical protein